MTENIQNWRYTLLLEGPAIQNELDDAILVITHENLSNIDAPYRGPVNFFDEINDDASDVFLSTDPEGNHVIPFELASLSKSNSTITIWCRVAILNSTNRTIYLHFGNPEANESPANRQSVWKDYLSVWHGINLDDSTGNLVYQNDGLLHSTEGPFGNSYYFENNTDSIFADIPPNSGYPLTVQVWIRPASLAGYKTIVGLADHNIEGRQVRLDMQGGRIEAYSFGQSASGSKTDEKMDDVQKWYRATGVWGSLNHRVAYLNSNKAIADTNSIDVVNINKLFIGLSADPTPSGPWEGYCAEVWIKQSDHSDIREEVEVSNQSSPADFWTLKEVINRNVIFKRHELEISGVITSMEIKGECKHNVIESLI